MNEPGLVARLRAAGCVFAEGEAVMLRAAAADDATLELMGGRASRGDRWLRGVRWAAHPCCGQRLRPARAHRTRCQSCRPASPAVVDRGGPVLRRGPIAAAVAHRRPDVTVWAA